jgi:hypothetical protein
MRSHSARRTATAAVVLIALAGCSSAAKPHTAAPAATSRVSTAATPSPPAVSATVPTEPGAQNLTASAAIKRRLLAVYAAAKALPLSQVTGPNAGTMYYGFMPSTDTYWAIAQFSLTPSAPQEAAVNMQDGGNLGVFSSRGGQTWMVRRGGMPFPCPGEIPAALMSVWNLKFSPGCVIATGQSPARSGAHYDMNLLNLPDGTYFGTIMFFELQLNGSGMMLFEPETWQGSSQPVSHSHAYDALDFSDATTAGHWTGTSRSDSREVTGYFDLAFARLVNDDMVPFTAEPYSGYEVVVESPAGCSGACATVASIVQLNSVAPLPANPNFTEP